MRPFDISEVATERLLLRSFRRKDWTELRRLDSDPEAMATLGGVRSEKETMAYVEAQVYHWETHGFGYWIVFDRTSRDFVGRGGFRRFEVEGERHVEVGYGLIPSCWGRGLATELAVAAVTAAFRDVELEALVALALPTNLASRRVLAKSGFREVGTAVYKDLGHIRFEQRRSEWAERLRPV